jgi:hypothetical protein
MNRVILQSRFTIAVKQKGVFSQFDGSNVKPVAKTNLKDGEQKAYMEEVSVAKERGPGVIPSIAKTPQLDFRQVYAQDFSSHNVVGYRC